MSLLALDNISYSVRGRELVSGVSIAFAPGTVSVMLGPNGAGKSTLVRLCCGELTPTSGRVLWDGKPLGQWPAWQLAAARAVLPQSSELSFPFTVGEVARLGIDVVGRALPAQARDEIVREGLARADIGHLAGRSYQTLSGGERQRVHFARTIAQLAAGRLSVDAKAASTKTGGDAPAQPLRQALFLDEPTASLDIHHQLLLMHEARRLADQGICVIAVLHDLNLAAATADRIVLLRGGRLIADDTPEQALSTARIRDVFDVETEILRPSAGGHAFSFSISR